MQIKVKSDMRAKTKKQGHSKTVLLKMEIEERSSDSEVLKLSNTNAY